jgi:hypothetical protein
MRCLPRRAAALLRAAWLAVGLGACAAGHASALRSCDAAPALSAAQQDLLIRFAAIVKTELQASGRQLAIVSRSGLDLGRWGQRYSHSGLSLQASENTPWSVRQLYYACDEARPLVFDQGLSAFVLGLNDPGSGYISVVLIPGEPADRLARTALSKPQALQMLADSYSANAFAFSQRYQNCNQWVIETIAAAWGGLPPGEGARGEAQAWLRAQGFVPATFELGWRPWMWLSHLVPWLHSDDHPADDLAQNRFRVSMPASIEAFVRSRVPEAERIEFCLREGRVVVRRGWEPLGEGCEPGGDDSVVELGVGE